MLRIKHYHTKRLKTYFQHKLYAESGDFLISRFFINQGAKGSLYFFFSPFTAHFYSFESLIYELKQ